MGRVAHSDTSHGWRVHSADLRIGGCFKDSSTNQSIRKLANKMTFDAFTRGAQRIYLSPPNLSEREKKLLLEAFDSNWITTLGPQVDAFEREMSAKLGVAHAVALSSGTAGLHLCLLAIGVKPGDIVLCSDLTFAASANPIVYCGAGPVFIDSAAESWNMDPILLEEALSDFAHEGKLPQAVIVVDLYGQSADYGRISAICHRFGVALIEDAAEALGATYEGKMCGSHGVMGVLSFNGNKIMTTSGGGMLLSNSEQLSRYARLLATQARDPAPYYQHSHIGYNYRLSNLLAAVGRGQLESLDDKVRRRREINRFYREALSDLPGISFMPEAPYGRPTCWLTCLTIDPTLFGSTNEDIRQLLERQNIESRNIWKPMHMQPIFERCKSYGGKVSQDLFERGICLPSGYALSVDELDRIVTLVRSCHRTSRTQ